MSVFNITFKLHEIHPNISMCFLKLKGTAENKKVANIDYNFRAAFEGGMQEQLESKVTVSNYDYEVVLEVLRFSYTGQVKGVKNFEKKLLDVILPNN